MWPRGSLRPLVRLPALEGLTTFFLSIGEGGLVGCEGSSHSSRALLKLGFRKGRHLLVSVLIWLCIVMDEDRIDEGIIREREMYRE